MDAQNALSQWREIFHAARNFNKSLTLPYVTLVRPNANLLSLHCLPASSMPAEKLAQMDQIVPSAIKRDITVLAPTVFEVNPADEAARPGTGDLQAAGRAIPFLGLLMGLAAIGHSVVIFDGQPSLMPYGCRDADALFIDSILAPKLTTKHVDDAVRVMRNANILIHDRASFQLKALRKVGTGPRIEFQ